MDIELRSLTFNHDPGSARNSALNLRVNAGESIKIPEWRAGRIRQSPAAYSIQDTAGATVLIEATLKGPANQAVEISAVPPSLAVPHVLGSVSPQIVGFDSNGMSGTVRFELANPAFVLAGVGVHDLTWRWIRRRSPLEAWTQFAETSHQIFTILRMPTLPWVQQPFGPTNTQLPWSDVLQWACRWAALTFTPQAAAIAITNALFASGGERFRYSCIAGAPTNYSRPLFDCSAFLERLAGEFGRGPNVNCSDCSTIVSTLANALGCDLSQSRMFNQIVPFAVNPIQLIGHANFEPVCGTGLFNYHEVAWDGLCTEFDEVYDACAAVLMLTLPRLSLRPLVPAAILFGLANQGLYRDLLAAPGSRAVCQPQPALSRMRRPVF